MSPSFAPTNSLIITDTGANLKRLANIIRDLDQPVPESKIEIVQLENSNADELAKILNEIMSQPAPDTEQSQDSGHGRGGNEVTAKIISYPAGRSLIVMARRRRHGDHQVAYRAAGPGNGRENTPTSIFSTWKMPMLSPWRPRSTKS